MRFCWQTSLICALGAGFLGTAAAQLQQDDPYIEVVSTRFTSPTVPAVNNSRWRTVDAEVLQVEIVSGVPVLLTVDGLMVASGAPGSVALTPVSIPHLPTGFTPGESILVLNQDGSEVVGVASPTLGLYTLECLFSGSPECKVTGVHADVAANAALQVTPPGGSPLLLVGGDGGLFSYTTDGTTPTHISNDSVNAISAAVVDGVLKVTTGGKTRVWDWVVTKEGITGVHWEWVSQMPVDDPADCSGGAYDGTVTALVHDEDGTLYVGTPWALNLRYPNGSITRVTGLQGLPYSNITSLSIGVGRGVDPYSEGLVGGTGARQRTLWVGTTWGLASVQLGALGDGKADGGSSDLGPAAPSSSYRVNEAGPPLTTTPPLTTPPSLWSHWRYYNGPRYLPTQGPMNTNPGNYIRSVAAPQGSTNGGTWGEVAFVVTDGGVAVLDHQTWTLSQKAELNAYQQSRHNRHGLVAECALSSFGADGPGTCINGPSDNNGLWTSLVAAANSFRYAVTEDPDAWTLAGQYVGGLEVLNDVTGIEGLMGRSAISPSFSPKPAPGGGHPWTNSTAPGWAGWEWKSSTSSDEVTGHMFAFPIVASLAAASPPPSLASRAPPRRTPLDGPAPLPSPSPFPPAPPAPVTPASFNAGKVLGYPRRIAHYIQSNGWTLVDFTGVPGPWGHWDPATINENVKYSDGRGVQSLQILAYLQAVIATAGGVGPSKVGANTTFLDAFIAGYTNLSVPLPNGPGYAANLLNLKIETNFDDNYSDDELTFLPYYSHAACSAAASLEGGHVGAQQEVQDSITRTFQFVQPWRSDLWGAVTLGAFDPNATRLAAACGAAAGGEAQASKASHLRRTSATLDGRGGGAASSPAPTPYPWSQPAVRQRIATDVVWNLRTWPLEATYWPVYNSHRTDLFMRVGANREGGVGTDSVRVLPAYERTQGRWNGDPHDLDQGGGTTEMDRGAWLLPYWMSRYHDIIGAPAAHA